MGEKTIRGWRSKYYKSCGSFCYFKRGKHRRHCLLDDEDLKEQSLTWIRLKAYNKKGPRLTAKMFQDYVNDNLIQSTSHNRNIPQSISLRTAYRWLHLQGFNYKRDQKGTYVDGHEREDVVAYRQQFIRKIDILQNSHLPPPLGTDNLTASYTVGKLDATCKLVLIFHDESVFHSNEDIAYHWIEHGRSFFKPKGDGKGIMVSDFVEEYGGMLTLTDREYEEIRPEFPNLPKKARELIEIGSAADGYWTNYKFLSQVEKAVTIAELKYPSSSHSLVFIFDQSSNHRAFAEDALNAKRMNVGPGGSQPFMHDTIWNGKRQTMVDNHGVQKGLKMVLQERGIDTSQMVKADMINCLSNMHDFKFEKSKVENHIATRGHRCLFLPKFHCELNPIERVWCRAKLYARNQCDYTFQHLHQTVQPALDSVTTDDVRKYFRTFRDYIEAYKKNLGVVEAEEEVKIYKSHRHIFSPNS